MSCEVYANGDELACKAGDGKVIAAFPDVCLSPPSPPAGPLPVPYADTSFCKDMQSGSKTVMIKDQEVMLKDSSFYKTSPLGDEAATNGLGAGVITHVITGKTYFVAWSMDVQFEGQNVDRHTDMTTSNHASPMANVNVPNPNLDAMATAKTEKATDECACCGAKPRMPGHSNGKPMTMDGWYGLNKKGADGKLTPGAKARRKEFKKMKEDYANRGCGCKVFPEKPCNVFRELKPGEKAEIDRKWKRKRKQPGFVESLGVDTVDDCLTQAGRADLAGPAGLAACKADPAKMTERETILTNKRKVDHRTPRSAGGCPTGTGNLVAHENNLCAECKKIDARFSDLQNDRAQGLLT
jgi:hypothetical protein